MSQNGHAQVQFSNYGAFQIKNNTILWIDMDYENFPKGEFVNDGLVYALRNFQNDGIVSYTDSKSTGQTTFGGSQIQRIFGSQISDFQKVVFASESSDLIPFQLETSISVGDNSDFLLGIINADQYKSKMIFKAGAFHKNASDLSFVDGMVEKTGREEFQFPVGNDLYFRPSYHASAGSSGVYTTQYFYKDSNTSDHLHANKDASILKINNQEYWQVTQDQGSARIVLSLTLDRKTTPSEFFNLAADETVAIVRWDGKQWVNDGGELSDPSQTENFEKLLTGTVSGYGIFTMATVKKKVIVDDVIVYNAVSPNGDGINDTFLIEGINQFPDNSVEIYNRWGVKVYDAKSYNESDNMFRGYSDGRTTVNRGDKLPTGTYFYILRYNNGKTGKEKSGYLYINNQ